MNKFSLTSLTVRDVPFNAIDPFFAINFIRFSGHSKVSLSLLSTFSQFTSFATPSICPVTICPPNSSPILRDFSKFIFFPITQGFLEFTMFVFETVSLETSTS